MTEESPKTYINGVLDLIPLSEWKEHREKTETAMEHLAAQQTQLASMSEDMRHLSTISTTLLDIKSGLLSAVIGKDVMSTSTAADLLKAQTVAYADSATRTQEVYAKIIRTISWVFGTIVVVLFGLKHLVPALFQ